MDGYVSKPFKAHELLAEITALLPGCEIALANAEAKSPSDI
jgi:DNA-binding response OmpR family regulator